MKKLDINEIVNQGFIGALGGASFGGQTNLISLTILTSVLGAAIMVVGSIQTQRKAQSSTNTYNQNAHK